MKTDGTKWDFRKMICVNEKKDKQRFGDVFKIKLIILNVTDLYFNLDFLFGHKRYYGNPI